MSQNNRVAIIAGLRTPFQKIATGYRHTLARELSAHLVKELVARNNLDSSEIDQVVFGQVVMSPDAPNLAREVVIGAGLPNSVDAYSVSRACASSYQSTINAYHSIVNGDGDVAIAGGCDVMSQPPISFNKAMTTAMVGSSYSRGFAQKLKAFKGIGFSDIMPKQPAIKDPSGEYTMGEAAEKMAKENGISREAQDALAHRSHSHASKAWEEGWFATQISEVILPPAYQAVATDNLIRHDSKLEKYARLKPVFDRQYGSVTAANSSPLTDGASAVLLMSEAKAKSLGYTPMAYIKSYAFSAIDPNWQMLMGPSFATPKALDKAGLSLKDMGLVDMHEAFAAQVLSNTQAFESKQFAQTHLNRSQAIGEINWDGFNVSGSSISIGHPFAATGVRQLNQITHDMHRTDSQFGLITACAAGGLGACIIIENA